MIKKAKNRRGRDTISHWLRSNSVEKRIDPVDGHAYTKGEIYEFYTQQGWHWTDRSIRQYWNQLEVAIPPNLVALEAPEPSALSSSDPMIPEVVLPQRVTIARGWHGCPATQ